MGCIVAGCGLRIGVLVGFIVTFSFSIGKSALALLRQSVELLGVLRVVVTQILGDVGTEVVPKGRCFKLEEKG